MGLAGGLGGDIASIGNAVGQLFQTQGNAAEANSYTSAAQLDEQNAQLTKASTAIQETQQARAVTQSLGTTRADVAGAGFTESGSALDILRSSASQGALATSLINIQGAINENAYAAEAGANYAKAKAANEANTAGTISAIASIGGALINGGTQLASAGNTVAKGYNYITGLFTSSGAAPTDLGSGLTTEFSSGVTGIGNTSTAIGSGIQTTGTTTLGSGLDADFGLQSAMDTSVANGALFTDTLSTTATDTSGIGLGTSVAAADEGIADATAGIGGGIASSVGADAAASVATDAAASAAADSAAAVGADVAADAGAAASADAGIGDALDSVGSVLFTVLCTALYKQGLVSRPLWAATRRYGQQSDPRTFAGYLFWASPLARMATKHKWFAQLIAPIFLPPLREEAVRMGLDVKRSMYGRVSFFAMYGLSWALGRIIITSIKREIIL